ncbi:MAG TPA: hypothetical protein VIK89_00960, partial [Cytophagaceae bacterium]
MVKIFINQNIEKAVNNMFAMNSKYIRLFFSANLYFLLILCIPLKACERKEVKLKQQSIILQHFDGDSIKVSANKNYKKNKVHNFLFGKHHRDLWAQPVTVEVFDINKERGGYKILKKGGSLQTLNLRLLNSDGKEYVLRTVDKDHSKVLPRLLRPTFLSPIFQDQTSALNPYASLIIPPLAEAAGLYHTNPKLYYVPYDTSFGTYIKEFAGRLVIVEEHPGDTWAGEEKFGMPDDIVGTDDFLEARYQDQSVRVDRLFYAKNRLFDILIGDWDRHTDQWKWGKKQLTNGEIFYWPIPRDRDMAFYKFDDGFLTFLALYFNPKFQTFHYDVQNVRGIIKNAYYLDRRILPTITREEWQQIALELQTGITDSAINYAVKQWPKEIYNMIGKETAAKLKTRRAQLPQIAMELHNIINEHPIITGTDKSEYIEVVRKPKETIVSVYEDDSKEVVMYQTSFENNLTKDIEIWALGGADEIFVTGEAKKGILIKIYGGEGYD